MQLTFLGGAGTVTGSKFLLEAGGERVLVDCGLFQGLKELRARNWEPLEVPPSEIGAVLLTHAHIDHSGYLPRLVHDGFRGHVHCTPPTRDLAHIMLPDSARIQEEDAHFYNRKKLSRHDPALPLYTVEDAERALERLRAQEYGAWFEPSSRFRVRFRDVGHILGSAMVDVVAREADREVHVLFSGDVGRYDMPLTVDPEAPNDPDYLLVESTYGDRLHPEGTPLEALRPLLERMLERRCVLLVPAFAVGRAQQIIYCARQLVRQRQLPRFPIYLDSPMAVNATEVYCKYPDLHDVTAAELESEDCVLMGPDVHLSRSVEQSKALNRVQGPALLISSSGMLTGGRVLHHLKRLLPDPRHMVALVGYQAAGTRGRALQGGARSIKVHGEHIPVRARLVDLGNLSGHADRGELLRWMEGIRKPPRNVFVTHGEPESAAALAQALGAKAGWRAHVAALGESLDL